MQFSLLKSTFYLILLAFFGQILFSCNKFEGDQEVPAYMRIDTIVLQTDDYLQGSNTHEIKDAWVYVDDQIMGVYELPALFPLLLDGAHKLEIYPGIKLNGISSTRAPYPFYQPYTVSEYTFYPDSVRTVKPVTSYRSTAVFAWKEDFENTGFTLENTSQSDTSIFRTEPNSPDALLSNYSAYSGKVVLDKDHPTIDIASLNAYELPGLGAPVLLELDCKTDIPVLIGMFTTEDGQVIDIPLVYVNESEKWNKLYINLGPNISEHTNASEFRVYFSATLVDQESATIFLDNIKLIYRPNQK